MRETGRSGHRGRQGDRDTEYRWMERWAQTVRDRMTDRERCLSSLEVILKIKTKETFNFPQLDPTPAPRCPSSQ